LRWANWAKSPVRARAWRGSATRFAATHQQNAEEVSNTGPNLALRQRPG
jgi:hypothetical protein